MTPINEIYSELNNHYNDMLSVSFQQAELLKSLSAELDRGDEDEFVILDGMRRLEPLFERRDQLALQIEALQKQILADDIKTLPAQHNKIISLAEEIAANDAINKNLLSSLQNATQLKIGNIRKNEKAYNAYTYVAEDPFFVDKKK